MLALFVSLILMIIVSIGICLCCGCRKSSRDEEKSQKLYTGTASWNDLRGTEEVNYFNPTIGLCPAKPLSNDNYTDQEELLDAE